MYRPYPITTSLKQSTGKRGIATSPIAYTSGFKSSALAAFLKKRITKPDPARLTLNSARWVSDTDSSRPVGVNTANTSSFLTDLEKYGRYSTTRGKKNCELHLEKAISQRKPEGTSKNTDLALTTNTLLHIFSPPTFVVGLDFADPL